MIKHAPVQVDADGRGLVAAMDWIRDSLLIIVIYKRFGCKRDNLERTEFLQRYSQFLRFPWNVRSVDSTPSLHLIDDIISGQKSDTFHQDSVSFFIHPII